MDDVETNDNKLAPIAEDETQNDDFMSVYGGEYLENRIMDFEEDFSYDWGEDGDKMHDLLKYLKDKPTLMGKFDKMLADIKMERNQDRKLEKIRLYKYLLRDAVSIYKDTDRLNENKWVEDKLYLEERENFLWEQKINNVNQVLENYGIKLDRNNKKLYNFLKENLIETFTDGDNEQYLVKNINGYKYADKRIIQRTKQKDFRSLENKAFLNFLERMRKFTINSARSEIVNVLGSDENTEITARECISELRDIEKKIIGGARTVEELTESRGTLDNIEKNIRSIKENEKFTIDKSIIFETMQGKLAKLRAWAEDNKTTLGVGGTSLLLSIISGLATSIPLIEKIQSAAKYAKKVGKGIEKIGRKITKVGNELDNVFKEPTKAVGAIVGLTGNIFENLVNFSIPLLALVIVGLILYIINKWIGVF